MKIETLRKKGFSLLNAKPYKAQTMPSGAQMIVLPKATVSIGQMYYEAVDVTGNILLIREDNLEL